MLANRTASAWGYHSNSTPLELFPYIEAYISIITLSYIVKWLELL